jgi:hypothetical protein
MGFVLTFPLREVHWQRFLADGLLPLIKLRIRSAAVAGVNCFFLFFG